MRLGFGCSSRFLAITGCVPGLEVRVMGRFQVLADGRPVPEVAWQHRRAAELVKLLALAEGHRAHSEWLQEEMFAALAPAAAAANLRKAVHYARTALGSADALRRHDEIHWPPLREPTSVA
jgi:DNA-binding SARP family transcriptional activator